MAELVLRLGGRVGATGEVTPVPEIVARAQRRDESAFAALYESHVDRIHRHIRARVGDDALAEDLTAQVFLRVWQSIHRYKPVPNRPFIAWLFAIANNLIIDHYRRTRREVVGVKGNPRTEDNDPERCALQQDLRGELQRALAMLKPEHQLVVSLRLVDGMSYEEIAAITGSKSVGALRVVVCRAAAALRDELRRRGVVPQA